MATTTFPLPEVWMKLHSRKRLLRCMAVQDVSVRTLAKAAGYNSHAYVGRLLRGEIDSLPVERATRIALYLGVGVDDLFLPEGSIGARHSDKQKVA